LLAALPVGNGTFRFHRPTRTSCRRWKKYSVKDVAPKRRDIREGDEKNCAKIVRAGAARIVLLYPALMRG